MSAGGYDGPSMPSSFSRFERGAPLNGIRNPYGRPTTALPRRPSPPSGSLRRPYDSYTPSRPEGSFRENTPNVYRPGPNSYRPDYTGSYYSRSPSPDPYVAPPRSSDPDIWDPHSWRPPPVETSNAVWPERKPLPASPTTSARGRAQRDDMPSRTFEPSDSWKQTHVDRPGRPDHSPPSDRYFDRRGRNSMDGSPERPMRLDRVPAFIPGGDRYRPGPPKREGYLMGRSDSYRPQYDNGRTPIRRDPISPPVSRMRRDSGSFTHTRTSSRHDSPYTARTLSRKGSPSPHSLISPIHTPSRPVPDADPWSYPASVKNDVSTRPLSRSSIASTQCRINEVLPPPQLPEPSIPEPPNSEMTSVNPIPNFSTLSWLLCQNHPRMWKF
ncbi:hypothetical protein BJ912DRAFT_557341 [Pholiota molesta]|nr:hypothetical protein BJ912DRAFT_557341 [Pholiota molesta]